LSGTTGATGHDARPRQNLPEKAYSPMFERFLQNGSIRKKLRLINLMTIGGAF
jgi:hypothetical protein